MTTYTTYEPTGKTKSYWRMLTDGSKFTFEKLKTDEENRKVYTFTYEKQGATKAGLPVELKKENGEWRVVDAQLF